MPQVLLACLIAQILLRTSIAAPLDQDSTNLNYENPNELNLLKTHTSKTKLKNSAGIAKSTKPTYILTEANNILPRNVEEDDLPYSKSRIGDNSKFPWFHGQKPHSVPKMSRDITLGPCVWAIDRKFPDNDVQFFLYTRRSPMHAQPIIFTAETMKSNLKSSYFNPRYSNKIIIHGYNADMFMGALHALRLEYLTIDEYNIFYVDWSKLAPAPCYISATHNVKHVGASIAMLVNEIRSLSQKPIHVIGYSLGAQVANYIARNLTEPLDRITGLDPAMPLFVTAFVNDKLDASDASFVDVIHTNALVQGKIERCGHADFYMNGGIMQPGCNAAGVQPFACSHIRALEYFSESIRSRKGFWGWQCSSYLFYLLGMCPPTNYLVEAGEHIKHSTKGMFLVETNDTAPYALGKWTDLPTLGHKNSAALTITVPPTRIYSDPLLRSIDPWQKLEMTFNNLQNSAEEFDGDVNEEVEFLHSKFAPNLTDPPFNWTLYKHNLTKGIFEQNLFKVPHVADQRATEKSL